MARIKVDTVVRLRTGQVCVVRDFHLEDTCLGVITVESLFALKSEVKEIKLGDIVEVMLPVEWVMRKQDNYTTSNLG